jgi:hypothetical protein
MNMNIGPVMAPEPERKEERRMNERRIESDMKTRIPIITIVVAALLSCGAPYAFAETAGDAEVYAAPVTLTESQTDFTVPVSIGYGGAFAGVELAVQCGEGVTVESVTYSKDVSHAGPTEARGLVWFTTFSGSNDYTGDLTAVIHASYTGKSNTSIVIDHAAFYSVDGSTYRTENVPLRRTVAIGREGATNDPPPLTPPVTEGPSDMVNSPGGGNPPSGNAVNSETPKKETTTTTTTTKKTTTKKTSGNSPGDKESSNTGANDSSTTNMNKTATGVPVTSDTSGLAPVVANVPLLPTGVGSAQGALNEQISSGDVGNEVPISSSEVPLAGGNATSTIPDGGAAALNMATLIMALACLAGVVFLGFLLIKRKRDEKQLKGKS